MNILDRPDNRSKRLLRRALIAQLEQKPYDKITINDICEQAELTRATFYRHYEDKQMLLDELLSDFLAGFATRIMAIRSEGKEKFIENIRSGCHPGFVGYFKYLRANQRVFAAFLREDSGVDITASLVRMLETVGFQSFTTYQKRKTDTPLTLELGRRTLAATYVAWAQNGMRVSDEEMATQITLYWASNMFPNEAIRDSYANSDTK